MSYTNIDNLKSLIPAQELINLTNDTAPATAIGEDKVNSAIKYAEEFINAYLRNKYILPLKYVPDLIVQVATDITAYRLYSRRPRKLPEHIKDAYDAAINVLKNLQKEQMILDLPAEHPTENVTPPAKMVVTNSTGSSRIFNDNVMRQFR